MLQRNLRRLVVKARLVVDVAEHLGFGIGGALEARYQVGAWNVPAVDVPVNYRCIEVREAGGMRLIILNVTCMVYGRSLSKGADWSVHSSVEQLKPLEPCM